jgi:NAD(P)-dependent dehydrogenase (short-subunit alcohol dehydrogenase family)
MNILITGCGRGIGYQTALALSAHKDVHVLALSRNKKNLERLQEDVIKQNKEAVFSPLLFDMEKDNFSDLVNRIVAKARKIDVLINNAATIVVKPFEELTEQEFEQVYRINVFKTAALIKHLIPLMERRGDEKSHIVNISSMGGFQGSARFAGLSAYSSSKSALSGLTECLAEEFKTMHIAVNCLCLGAVDTDMLREAFPGYKASVTAAEMGKYIGWFAINGQHYHNGKIIPVSSGTP